MNADSSCLIPRRKQQASDVRRKLLRKEDELALLVERFKINVGEKAYIRCVSLAPEPVVILCSDFQLSEDVVLVHVMQLLHQLIQLLI